MALGGLSGHAAVLAVAKAAVQPACLTALRNQLIAPVDVALAMPLDPVADLPAAAACKRSCNHLRGFLCTVPQCAAHKSVTPAQQGTRAVPAWRSFCHFPPTTCAYGMLLSSSTSPGAAPGDNLT